MRPGGHGGRSDGQNHEHGPNTKIRSKNRRGRRAAWARPIAAAEGGRADGTFEVAKLLRKNQLLRIDNLQRFVKIAIIYYAKADFCESEKFN